ncbi:MAG: hypothetical protein GXY34_13310 [Syntrophomonadaceae bacterium]|nr:hypothetical protein [Syntrophomonadaceae bacterium]
MGKYNKPKGGGWSKEEEVWLNSLPIQDAADLFRMSENGPDNEKDEETINARLKLNQGGEKR